MTGDTVQTVSRVSAHGGNGARDVGRFVWHFAQMVVAMHLGMCVFHVLFGKAISDNPALHTAMMDLFMVVPMVALMAYQRHSQRHTVEMVAAMLAGPAIAVACIQLDLHAYIPGLSIGLFNTFGDVTMYVGMLAVMIYRRDHFLGHHVHTAQVHASHT